MSDYTAPSTKRALAQRTTMHSGTSVPSLEIRAEPLDAGLLEDLRDHLLAGETHYTTRPGVLELRQQLARRITITGGPEYDAERETIITAGEGEALFATLLGLGLSEGSLVSANDEGGRHSNLFAILGIQVVQPADPNMAPPLLEYSELATDKADADTTGRDQLPQEAMEGDLPCQTDEKKKRIVNVGSLAFGGSTFGWPAVGPRTVVIGNFDGLAGISSFRLGYVVGPKALLKKIMAWKQAFSICTAAPSQRAAIWTLDQIGYGKQ
jgi:aspartate/methionine/tyrosine aminotransferase